MPRRTDPRFAVALGILLPVIASVIAEGLWDGRFRIVPATWLLGSVLVAMLVAGTWAGATAVATAVALYAWRFLGTTDDSAEIASLASFVVMAVSVTAVIDVAQRARRRADRTLASLDALVVHSPVGIAFLDRDLRFVRANDALSSVAGRRSSDHIGKTLDEVVRRPGLSAIARSVLETGEPRFDVDVGGTAVDGRRFHAMAAYYPVPGPDGEIEGVGVVVRDVTTSVQASEERDRLLARVTRLQLVTGALAAARTTDDVARVVLDDIRRAAEADAVSLCEVAGDEVVVVASHGYPDDVLQPWRRFPISADTPLGEAVLSARLVIADRQEMVSRWPTIGLSLAGSRRAAAAVPMVVDGEVRGAIGLSYDRDRIFDAEDEAFLAALATQCADAFDRVRLRESEEAAASRLGYLTEASDALASSLDATATLHQIAELAVPRLADVAAVLLVDGEDVLAQEVVDVDPARGEKLRRIAERWPARLDNDRGLGALARRGEPLLATGIGREQLLAAGRDQEHATALVGLGFTSILVVPMRANDRVVGLIVLADAPPRELGEDDLALATELATRAGQAVVNAELYRERSRVAAILQASLLPPVTPTVPGLEVATRFFAVGAGIDVGGDFYDVFRLGTADAPADRWGVVIGDVRGKGTEAASISGAARHAVRAAALHQSSPAAMLGCLNELLLVLTPEDDLEPRFCTAAVAVVEPRADGATIVLASGGHPPPMVLRADGTTEAVEAPGSLLGVVSDPEITEVHLELGVGDGLVLYTDGVTERHAGTRFFDEEGLAAVLSRCVGFTAPVLAERIETASRAFVEDAPRDDLAIVVVRVPERAGTSAATSADLPADRTAPMFARRFVEAALDALGLEGQTEVATLLASEVVTNALVHAEPPFRISVEGVDGHVRVTVSDGSPGEPTVLAPDHARPSGRGMYLVEAMAARWGVSPGPNGKSVWFELPL